MSVTSLCVVSIIIYIHIYSKIYVVPVCNESDLILTVKYISGWTTFCLGWLVSVCVNCVVLLMLLLYCDHGDLNMMYCCPIQIIIISYLCDLIEILAPPERASVMIACIDSFLKNIFYYLCMVELLTFRIVVELIRFVCLVVCDRCWASHYLFYKIYSVIKSVRVFVSTCGIQCGCFGVCWYRERAHTMRGDLSCIWMGLWSQPCVEVQVKYRWSVMDLRTHSKNNTNWEMNLSLYHMFV